MSRYIIVPKLESEDGVDNIFQLIPTEGITELIKEVELPEGIIPKIGEIKKVSSNEQFNNLMLKFTKANIGRNKDGLITINNKVLEIRFDDFVVDSCNAIFKEEYEKVYCLLRTVGITF